MAAEEFIDNLKVELVALAGHTDLELISRQDWGSINFENARADIDLALSIATDLLDLPLQYLTDTAAQNIAISIPPVTQYLEEINAFSLEGGDPGTRRDNICVGLHNAVESLHANASPSIPYLAYRRGDIADNIAELNKAVGDAQKTLEGAEVWTGEKKDEIDKIAQAARDAAASAGVATFTEEFRGEALNLETRSKRWLWATSGFAVATIVAAILLYHWPEILPEAGAWETLRNIVSKAAIIAVLFTGTIWCGRIYRALVHQATVNRHRALSLKTFQAFAKATDDPYVKDAVLMAATKAVFENVPTGLVESDGAQDSGVNFVEFGKPPAEKIVKAAAEAPE